MKQQSNLIINLCYLYFFLLPIEDFFLQDYIGSSTRITVGVLIVIFYYYGNSIKWDIMPKYIFIYLGIAVASVLFWANNPNYYAIFRISMWVITSTLIANLTYSYPKLSKSFFNIYTVSALYLVLEALNLFLNSDTPDRVDVEGMNENILAMHFLVTSLYCFYNLFDTTAERNKKLISIIGLVIFIGAMITTGSRSAMLSLGLGMIIILPKSLNRIGSLIFFGLVSLILILSISEDNVFVRFASTRFQQAQDDKGAGRIVIWKVAEEMIIENPILGVGFRNFPTEFKNYIGATPLDIEETNKLGDRDYAGTHNNALEILAELGIFGFISFFGLQIVICIRLFKLFKIIPLSKLLFALIVSMNFNGFFGDLTNLKIYWTIIGVSCGLSYYWIRRINNGYTVEQTA